MKIWAILVKSVSGEKDSFIVRSSTRPTEDEASKYLFTIAGFDGGVKLWKRSHDEIPLEYLEILEASPTADFDKLRKAEAI